MMPDSQEFYVDLLERVAVALIRGDWRTAMLLVADGGDAGGHSELVVVAFCLTCVARCLQLQAVLGDVQAAREQIDVAIQELRASGPVPHGAEPPRRMRLVHLKWVIARLVEREQGDLTALREVFGTIPRGRQELFYAGIEHLTHVEFEPYTVQVHAMDRELTGLDATAYARWRAGNCLDICVRATCLRQFADVRSGSVTGKTWQRLGGYPAVREHALRLLAAESLARRPGNIPVRLGRQRAWEYACRWRDDTAA